MSDSDIGDHSNYGMYPVPRSYDFNRLMAKPTTTTTSTTPAYLKMPYQFFYPYFPTTLTEYYETTPSTTAKGKVIELIEHIYEKLNLNYQFYFVKTSLDLETTQAPIPTTTKTYRKKSQSNFFRTSKSVVKTVSLSETPAPPENYRPNKAQALHNNGDFSGDSQLMYDDTKNIYYYLDKHNDTIK